MISPLVINHWVVGGTVLAILLLALLALLRPRRRPAFARRQRR